MDHSESRADAPLTRRQALERERSLASRQQAAASANRDQGRLPSVRGEAGAQTAQRIPALTQSDSPGRALARRSGRHRPAFELGRQVRAAGAMLFAAALLVGVSIPASAFSIGPDDAAAATLSQARLQAGRVDIQSYEVSAEAMPTGAGRDAWSSLSWAQILDQRYTTRDYSYRIASGSVRWPFTTEVRISDGFGYRVSPCSGCSSYHQGVDFLPGNGAPIYAIADGVVTDRESGGGGFGNYVTITHVIDGVKIESTYAHMQSGSSSMQLGQSVVVGEFLGLVGETGAATGPHLHLEIKVEGEKVDPFAWLQANVR